MKFIGILFVICAIFILPGSARIPISPLDKEVGDSVVVDSTTKVDTSTVKFASFANQCCCDCERPPIPIGQPSFQCKFVCPLKSSSITTTPSTTTTPIAHLGEDPLPKESSPKSELAYIDSDQVAGNVEGSDDIQNDEVPDNSELVGILEEPENDEIFDGQEAENSADSGDSADSEVTADQEE